MNEYQILLDVVRQTFASIVWTHKIQEKQADIYNEKYALLETINIFIVSLTACGIFSLIFTDQLWVKITASFLSLLTVAISIYDKTFHLHDLGIQHKIAANKFLMIRNELLQIIAAIHIHQEPIDIIDKRYQELLNNLNKIYSEVPITSDKAVERATVALKANSEFTYSEEEIDNFLPPTLRGHIK